MSPARRAALLSACTARDLRLLALTPDGYRLTLYVARGPSMYELRATADRQLAGEAAEEYLLEAALAQLNTLWAQLGEGAGPKAVKE